MSKADNLSDDGGDTGGGKAGDCKLEKGRGKCDVACVECRERERASKRKAIRVYNIIEDTYNIIVTIIEGISVIALIINIMATVTCIAMKIQKV